MARKKRDEEDLDFGSPPEDSKLEEAEEDVHVSVQGHRIERQDDPSEDRIVNEYVRLNRIVDDPEEIRFSGTVRAEDVPACPCCSERWIVSEGAMMPGCGCVIHPVCHKCGKCEPHCGGHRK